MAYPNNVIDVTPRKVNIDQHPPFKALFWAWSLFAINVAVLEGGPIALHTLLFSENIDIGADLYWSDLPFIYWLFPDLSASTIFALILACACVLTPCLLWKTWLSRPSNFDIREFFNNPLNVIFLTLVICIYFALIGVEIMSLQLYLTREPVIGALPSVQEKSVVEQYSILTSCMLAIIVNGFGFLIARQYLATINKLRGLK